MSAKRRRYRSAISGQYVSAAYAKANRDTTIGQTLEARPEAPRIFAVTGYSMRHGSVMEIEATSAADAKRQASDRLKAQGIPAEPDVLNAVERT